MVTYRSRSHGREHPVSLVLQALAVIAIAAPLALLLFVAFVWIWVGTAP